MFIVYLGMFMVYYKKFIMHYKIAQRISIVPYVFKICSVYITQIFNVYSKIVQRILQMSNAYSQIVQHVYS